MTLIIICYCSTKPLNGNHHVVNICCYKLYVTICNWCDLDRGYIITSYLRLLCPLFYNTIGL